MKTVLGIILIVGALAGLLLKANPWASVVLAVLGGVLVDAADVTAALKVVAPLIPGKLGQRLSGGFPPPPPPPEDGGKHP